jgi:alpha/beta superfamily hydrolase
MNRPRQLLLIGALALMAGACDVATSSTPLVTAEPGATADAGVATTAEAAGTTTSTAVEAGNQTTTTALPRELDMTIEPGGFEVVTITTEDGIDLHGKFWEGGETAVLFGHDFDNPTPGAAGQRPPQSSEWVLPYPAALAREGLTVLAFDFRGHGQSDGEYAVRESQLDLTATYRWLVDRGFEKIVMAGWVGSGTSAVVLDVASDEIDFAGIMMLFSPPQDTGLDADSVLGQVEAPMYFIGTNAGTSASWARRMSAKAPTSVGVYVYDRVPSGLTFLDVYGGDFAGRIYEFAQSV